MKQDNHIGYKIKLYPTKEQEQIFKEYFGACRFVYNLGIDLQNKHYEKYKEGKEKFSVLSYFDDVYMEVPNANGVIWVQNHVDAGTKAFGDQLSLLEVEYGGVE